MFQMMTSAVVDLNHGLLKVHVARYKCPFTFYNIKVYTKTILSFVSSIIEFYRFWLQSIDSFFSGTETTVIVVGTNAEGNSNKVNLVICS